MKTRFNPIVVAGLLAFAVPAVPVFAQSPAAGRSPSPTDRQIAQLVQQTTERIAQAKSAAMAGQPPAAGGATTSASTQPTAQLSLEQAVKDALDRNLNIAVQRLTPQTYDYTLASLHAAYLPSVNSQFSTNGQTTPATSQLSGGQSVVASNQAFNAGLSENVPWGGGSMSVTWNNTRGTTTNSFSTYNPAYNTSFLAQYHAAAAARLRDRLDARTARRSRT